MVFRTVILILLGFVVGCGPVQASKDDNNAKLSRPEAARQILSHTGFKETSKPPVTITSGRVCRPAILGSSEDFDDWLRINEPKTYFLWERYQVIEIRNPRTVKSIDEVRQCGDGHYYWTWDQVITDKARSSGIVPNGTYHIWENKFDEVSWISQQAQNNSLVEFKYHLSATRIGKEVFQVEDYPDKSRTGQAIFLKLDDGKWLLHKLEMFGGAEVASR